MNPKDLGATPGAQGASNAVDGGDFQCQSVAMHFIFIYGPVALGKLAIAREVAEQTGFALFHRHLIVGSVDAVFSLQKPFVRLSRSTS